MLVFLDGRLNVSGNPNENYARELLELYSIGRGLEGTLPPATEPGDYFHFTEQECLPNASDGSVWFEWQLPASVVYGACSVL